MASVVYPKAKEALLKGDLDLDGDVRIILVDVADYTYSAAHDFLDDVLAAARVATSGALTGKTFTNGVFDADDVTLTAVTGDVSEAIVVYRHTGVEATSNLIAYIDSATGLPVTPNGGDITVAWDAGANKIFAL
jgi:hypothetical protein